MFNGSVLNFAGSPVTRVVGMRYRTGGAWVDVSEPEDLNKLFEMGQTELVLNVQFKGHCGLTSKAKGVVSITWADGTTTSAPGTWQVGPIDDGGDWDAPITGSAELRPTVPDVS
jgi:hypothetical protein